MDQVLLSTLAEIPMSTGRQRWILFYPEKLSRIFLSVKYNLWTDKRGHLNSTKLRFDLLVTLPIFSQFNCDDLSSQTSYPNTKRTTNEELIQQKKSFIYIYLLPFPPGFDS